MRTRATHACDEIDDDDDDDDDNDDVDPSSGLRRVFGANGGADALGGDDEGDDDAIEIIDVAARDDAHAGDAGRRARGVRTTLFAIG